MTTMTQETTAPPARVEDGDVRVLLLENVHPDGAANLRDQGYQVETVGGALDEATLIERVKGVHLLGIRSGTQITEAVLDAADSLLAIGAFCIGTNQIDLNAASARGIAVFNAPFSNTRSVVELAIAEIISLARRLGEKSNDMHSGKWNKSAKGSHEIRGRRLGIVGYGNIGSQLSVVAEALGMSVYFYDTADKLALGNAKKCETLHELLESVDAVTLHVDGRPGNAGLFGPQEFARMKPQSIFMNLSRGILVDMASLRENIESGHIAGAAIDVFPVKPKKQGDPFESELRGLNNVILTPHVGGSTMEAQQDIGRFVSGKLISYLKTGSTELSPNLPDLVVPPHDGAHRIVHIHRNMPGVLATINSLLGDHDVNIEAQSLGTAGHIGYVVTDVGSAVEAEVLNKLAALDETIRLRLLS
ncbi:MAG TPA: phosphoglycerate dehydrogenase [Nocardioidaceae bacterium]|nr:phosphoglycerate dehydrogenase [Nocardioidaceae bacterium]